MHLIAPLTAGIRGAENGFVTLLLRGTSTVSSYYADFEATQQFPGTLVELDSNGRLIAYVSALVDVQVLDANGVLICEFVAGAEDAAVEVISPSFTGVDYVSGASGTQKPTHLEKVLDAWIASAGAPDWKVLVNGLPVALQSIASPFFNVKAYGAIGNGTADDSTAIAAANAAAVAVGGGIVYFPPGVYRTTTSRPLAQNVMWLGNGGTSTKIAIDSGVGSGTLTLPANAAGSCSSAVGLWFGAINGANPGVTLTGDASTTGEFHFTDCVFGNDALSNAQIYINNASVAGSKVVFTRCYMKLNAGASPLLQQFGAGRMLVRDCDIISNQATPGNVVICEDGGHFEGNRFDASAGTLGTVVYITAAPGTSGGVVVVGNRFAANATLGAAACFAMKNTLATPINDIMESCNIFGDASTGAVGITPYSYTTDGYVSFASTFNALAHLTRVGKTEVVNAVLAAETVNPKAFGTTVVRRLAGAALTLNANKGSQGDRWTLHILNATGAGLTVTPGANIILDPGVTAGTLVLGIAGFSECNLQWLPDAAGVGHWYLSAKAVTS